MSQNEPLPQIRLIVGLGNPGRKYVGTRHNVGFDAVERLASFHGLNWAFEKKWNSEVARRGRELIFLKPQTFMNLSGEAIARVGKFFKVDPEETLVVYDDADLALGRLRFRLSGSAGGHNGIKSTIACLGTNEFPRLKIGISGGGDPEGMIGHVLGKFREEERNELEKSLARAVEGVNYALSKGLGPAMTEFNQTGKTKKSQKKKSPKIESTPREESDRATQSPDGSKQSEV